MHPEGYKPESLRLGHDLPMPSRPTLHVVCTAFSRCNNAPKVTIQDFEEDGLETILFVCSPVSHRQDTTNMGCCPCCPIEKLWFENRRLMRPTTHPQTQLCKFEERIGLAMLFWWEDTALILTEKDKLRALRLCSSSSGFFVSQQEANHIALISICSEFCPEMLQADQAACRRTSRDRANTQASDGGTF